MKAEMGVEPGASAQAAEWIGGGTILAPSPMTLETNNAEGLGQGACRAASTASHATTVCTRSGGTR